MHTSNAVTPRPVVAVVCNRFEAYYHPTYGVPETYLDALYQAAGVMPMLLPVCPSQADAAALLERVDGVLLPGSPSNVAAERYRADPLPEGTLMDLYRDDVVFNLLPSVVAMQVPLFAICRGFQELNVYFGGTLERAVHNKAGFMDHREGDHSRPLVELYQDKHSVQIQPDGLLASLVDDGDVMVNSLHHQGIEKPGNGLQTEALAPDGLIEAFTVPHVASFMLAVQWHPEMSLNHSAMARAMFTRFGDACRARQQLRSTPSFAGARNEH